MNSFQNEPKALKVWFDEYNMWVSFVDGRQLSVPLVYFPKLQNAEDEARTKFEISGGGVGLHWDDLDEDIYVPQLLLGQYDQSTSQLAQ